MHFNTKFLSKVLSTCFESLKFVLVSMVAFLILSAKSAILDFFKILVFWVKSYDVIIFVDDFAKKTQSCYCCSWFRFNYLGVAIGMALKLCTSVEKRVKTKSQKVYGPNCNVCRTIQEEN